MPQFKNQKFKVPNNTVGKLLQQELMGLGYRWESDGRRIREENITYYYTTEHGHIQYGSTQGYFDRQPHKEVIVVTESRLVIAELKPVRDKIILLGKTYYKDDVEAALSKLERATV